MFVRTPARPDHHLLPPVLPTLAEPHVVTYPVDASEATQMVSMEVMVAQLGALEWHQKSTMLHALAA